jgi:SpoIID/LytB domain protein
VSEASKSPHQITESPHHQTLDLTTEEGARKWIMSNPDAFCNTSDKKILSQVLNDYDQETIDFYRWKVVYSQDELTALVARHAPQLGKIVDLIPLKRGVSGRIYELNIVGENGSIIIGKELEIRKWLSNSHLYSSAFVVEKEGETFTLYGAGWGHGVGLCQIGAAVMAEKGYTYQQILAHYYPNTEIKLGIRD